MSTWRRRTGTDTDKKWRPPWASVPFQQTAKEMRRSSVQFYSKQRSTTSLLDDPDSTRNLYQQRYWMWWQDEMTSVKEIPPRLNCQDWIMTSRTASTHTKGKNGEILLWPGTRRQMSPSCGELLKELMADQNARQRTKSLDMTQTFTTDLVRRSIKSCRNSKALGPDKLSIFHLKILGPRAIEYITALFNLSVTTREIPAIWKPQNEALRNATGCHKMSSVDHLHVEAKMRKAREHPELLSAQYLARCLEPGNVCHSITTRETPKRRVKETLFTRHRNTVEPMMLANNRKATLQAIHSDAVNEAVKDQKNNIVLDGLPHPINDSEKYLIRKERATLAQLRSGYCKLLGSYKSSSDDIESVRPVEQTSENYPGIQLSRGGKPRLRRPRRTTTTYQYVIVYNVMN